MARAVDQPPDVAEVARTAPRRSAGAVAGVRGGAVVNGGFSPGQGSRPDVGRGRTRITGAVLASREPAHLSLGRSASNGADRAPWRPAGRAPRAVWGRRLPLTAYRMPSHSAPWSAGGVPRRTCYRGQEPHAAVVGDAPAGRERAGCSGHGADHPPPRCCRFGPVNGSRWALARPHRRGRCAASHLLVRLPQISALR